MTDLKKPGKIISKSSAEHEFDVQVARRKELKEGGINFIVDLLEDLDRNTDELIRLTKIIEAECSKSKGN